MFTGVWPVRAPSHHHSTIWHSGDRWSLLLTICKSINLEFSTYCATDCVKTLAIYTVAITILTVRRPSDDKSSIWELSYVSKLLITRSVSIDLEFSTSSSAGSVITLPVDAIAITCLLYTSDAADE